MCLTLTEKKIFQKEFVNDTHIETKFEMQIKKFNKHSF